MKSEMTYTESSAALNRSARAEAFKIAAAHLLKHSEATAKIGELRVVRLNQLRDAGLQITVGCGRKQLQFNIDGIEFCRREILPHMPPGIGIEQIHGCVLIANKMKEPAKTAEEAAALEKVFQQEFELLGLVPSHKRRELQSSHARNLFSEFVSRTASLKLLFDELTTEQPIEKWPTVKLDEFLEETQPIKALILRAEKLRLCPDVNSGGKS